MSELAADARRPVVVVDELHVTYRVFAGGKAVRGATGSGLLKRATRGIRSVKALKGVSFVAHGLWQGWWAAVLVAGLGGLANVRAPSTPRSR